MVHKKVHTGACLLRNCFVCVEMGSCVHHSDLSSLAEDDWNFRASPLFSPESWDFRHGHLSPICSPVPCPLSLYTFLETEPTQFFFLFSTTSSALERVNIKGSCLEEMSVPGSRNSLQDWSMSSWVEAHFSLVLLL